MDYSTKIGNVHRMNRLQYGVKFYWGWGAETEVKPLGGNDWDVILSEIYRFVKVKEEKYAPLSIDDTLVSFRLGEG